MFAKTRTSIVILNNVTITNLVQLPSTTSLDTFAGKIHLCKNYSPFPDYAIIHALHLNMTNVKFKNVTSHSPAKSVITALTLYFDQVDFFDVSAEGM